MKDSKQSLRYIGFECRKDGERRLRFSVDGIGADQLLVSFDIAALFFAGKQRILLQEAAGICYSKLKEMLHDEVQIPSESILTKEDILQYRQIPLHRTRATRLSGADQPG